MHAELRPGWSGGCIMDEKGDNKHMDYFAAEDPNPLARSDRQTCQSGCIT